MNVNKGFTLIEVLIVIIIIGVLAGIAYPAYTKYVLETKRAEAQVALVTLANKQEMYYLDHRQYAENLATELGQSANPLITENGYYSISTSSASPTTGFVLTATAIDTQANDQECASLSINHQLEKSALTKSGDSSSECWK